MHRFRSDATVLVQVSINWDGLSRNLMDAPVPLGVASRPSDRPTAELTIHHMFNSRSESIILPVRFRRATGAGAGMDKDMGMDLDMDMACGG